MAEESLLDVRELSKSYGETTALDRFSLSLAPGEVLGLLGPNGAGKTTLISILSGTLRGAFGSVRFRGQDLFADRRLRQKIGVVPQEMAFYEELSAGENLAFFARLYGMSGRALTERVAELLGQVELDGRAREPVKNFSGGMKRRLNLAIGLMHRPELLLLDEPTVGIDVQAKVRILEIVRRAAEGGAGVLFTSHQLAEVEETCSRVVVMDRGSVLAQGTLAELVHIVGEKEIVAVEGRFTAEALESLLRGESFFDVLMIGENRCELAFARSADIPRLIERLIAGGIAVSDIQIKSPGLETVFLRLTGRSLRD